MEYALFRSAVVIAALAGAGSFALPQGCPAQMKIGGSVAIVSDYVYRGYSRSGGDPALQAGVQWSDRRWAMGAWASTVELLPHSRSAEFDIYLHRRMELSDNLTAGIGATWHSFPDDPRPVSYEYGELAASLNWRQRLHLEVAWAPDLTLYSPYSGPQHHRSSWTTELTLAQPLHWGVSGFIGVGHFSAPQLRGAGYSFGSLGFSRDLGRWHAELSYFRNGGDAGSVRGYGADGGPVAATLAWHF
jgi:uncharacterized protein (TIGR02001 family)